MSLLASPRDDMTTVFREPRFDRSPSWVSRAASAVRRGVSRAIDAIPFGTLGRFLAWIAVVLAVIGVALIVIRAVRRAVARRRDRHGGAEPVIGEVIDDLATRDADQWRAAASDYETEQDWKEAIRCRYAELVQAAFALGCAVNEPGRTTGEVRRDLAASCPECADAFAEMTDLFELVWFADRAATRRSHEHVLALGEWIRPRLVRHPEHVVVA